MIKINHNKFLLALAKAGMTTTDLSAKSGVGRSTISKILHADIRVKPAIVGKLAKALNIDVEQIIYIK